MLDKLKSSFEADVTGKWWVDMLLGASGVIAAFVAYKGLFGPWPVYYGLFGLACLIAVVHIRLKAAEKRAR